MATDQKFSSLSATTPASQGSQSMCSRPKSLGDKGNGEYKNKDKYKDIDKDKDRDFKLIISSREEHDYKNWTSGTAGQLCDFLFYR